MIMIPQDRIKHMHGVAEYMFANAEKFGVNKHRMYTLGLLHDIGHIYGKNNHELYGADLLAETEFLYADLVAWHEMTPNEYMKVHNYQPQDIPKELILLWKADMLIDITGRNVGYEARLDDIGNRHGFTSETYLKCQEKVDWLRNNNY